MRAPLSKLTHAMARQELAKVSEYTRNRSDLVQASGGNASVKADDGRIFIKASGCRLGEVTAKEHVAEVRPFLETRGKGNTLGRYDAKRLELWNESCFSPKPSHRPSMELSFHALLGPVVLHTHPICVNAVLCTNGARRRIREMLPDQDFTYLPYAMPGIELGKSLWQALTVCPTFDGGPQIIFLESHGLVIHGENAQDVIEMNEWLLSSLADHLPEEMAKARPVMLKPTDVVDRRLLQAIVAINAKRPTLACLSRTSESSEDSRKLEPGQARVLFPDSAVFCGPDSITLQESTESALLQLEEASPSFTRLWREPPRVFSLREFALCTGATVAEANSAAEVWWAHQTILEGARHLGSPQWLSDAAVLQLLGSEAERHRQTLAQERGSALVEC